MARKLRIQYPGAVYHLLNRGDRREPIFKDDEDRERFLQTLEETCAKTGWRVHAFCLLPDHFHLLVETPQANLVEGMKWFLGTYTARFNRRHRMGGHLFSGRYKSQYVDPEDHEAMLLAAAYIHLNPSRLALVDPEQPLDRFAWSSLKHQLASPSTRPVWLEAAPLLRLIGLEDTTEGRKGWGDWTEARRLQQTPDQWVSMRTGWFVGKERFRQQLLEKLRSSTTSPSTGAIWKASDAHHAEQLLQKSLEELGWDTKELGARAKTDPQKVSIARQLRRDTTMTISWIAERLQMGTRNTLRNALAAEDSPSPFNPEPKKNTASTPFRAAKPTVSAPIPVIPPKPSSEESSFQVEPGWD